MTAVKELAKLYLALKQPRVALSLFDNALALDAMEFGNEPGAYNAVEGEESDEEDQEQGWVGRRIQFEEINMIAELYMETDEYELAIDFIKKEVRKLQGRWGESGLWDASDNDDEYGEAVEDAEERLPLELRVKLGICRLWTDELDLARVGLGMTAVIFPS